MDRAALQALARLGARARIEELKAEIVSLEPIANKEQITFAPEVRKRRRRMPRAARAAISRRMKAYWAARNKGK